MIAGFESKNEVVKPTRNSPARYPAIAPPVVVAATSAARFHPPKLYLCGPHRHRELG